MTFNEKEIASNKLFQYTELSDKQWDTEHKWKAPRKQVRLLIMGNSNTRAKKSGQMLPKQNRRDNMRRDELIEIVAVRQN